MHQGVPRGAIRAGPFPFPSVVRHLSPGAEAVQNQWRLRCVSDLAGAFGFLQG